MLKAQDIEMGKWYVIMTKEYPYGIKGKAVNVFGENVTLKFYWGTPYRTKQHIEISYLLGECEPPELFTNY